MSFFRCEHYTVPWSAIKITDRVHSSAPYPRLRRKNADLARHVVFGAVDYATLRKTVGASSGNFHHFGQIG